MKRISIAKHGKKLTLLVAFVDLLSISWVFPHIFWSVSPLRGWGLGHFPGSGPGSRADPNGNPTLGGICVPQKKPGISYQGEKVELNNPSLGPTMPDLLVLSS